MAVSNHPLSPEDLMAYLDGELGAVQMDEASEHLAHCRECQSLAADLQAVSRELASWETAAPSAASQCPASGRVNGFMGLLVMARKPWNRYQRQISVAVAVLLAVAGTLFLHKPEVRPIRADESSAMASRSADAERPGALQDKSAPVYKGKQQAKVSPRALALSMQSAKEQIGTEAMIARTALLRITVTEFSHIQEAVLHVVEAEKGYVSRLEISGPPSGSHALNATLQIPSQHLDATLVELKRLGRVEGESQTGEDVARQVVDVEARLSNLRAEEGRLNEILRDRTGKLSDVLAVEQQISNVREQIEVAHAERKKLGARVAYASITISVEEEYRRTITRPEQPSVWTTLHNAGVEGVSRLEGFLLDLVVLLLSSGPLLLTLAGGGFAICKLIAWLRIRQRNTG